MVKSKLFLCVCLCIFTALSSAKGDTIVVKNRSILLQATLSDLIVYGDPNKPEQKKVFLKPNDPNDDILFTPLMERIFDADFQIKSYVISMGDYVKGAYHEWETFVFDVKRIVPKQLGMIRCPAGEHKIVLAVDQAIAPEPPPEGTIFPVANGRNKLLVPGWFVGTGINYDTGQVTGAYTGYVEVFSTAFEGLVFTPSYQPKVLSYDDNNPSRLDINQGALFAVRFTPAQPFNLTTVYAMFRNDYNTTDGADVWVAQNKDGIPQWPAIAVGRIPPPLTNRTWLRFDLAGPMYFEGDFFIIIRQKGGPSPGPGFWIGLDYGTTTRRTVKSYNNGQGWLDEPLGDALIRAGGLLLPSESESLVFSQIDFNLAGSTYTNSEWGAVDFTFTGQEPIMYFNLTVNGSWQVQNIPVLSVQGAGVWQTMTYYFDLGTVRGMDVRSLTYGYSFTPDIITTMPLGRLPAFVGDDQVEIWPGLTVTDPDVGWVWDLEPAQPLVGGKVAEEKKCTHKDFPNQESEPNACVPTAVSNSIQLLNKKYSLRLTAEQVSITKMKDATKWKRMGCWGDPDPKRPEGERNAWWQDKKKYMEDNAYPISTSQVTDINEVYRQLCAGQDVEIRETWPGGGHVTALIGITKLKNGKYSLDVVDDRKQGQPGGCDNPRTYTYDPATRKIDEVGFISKFEYAVVECPTRIVIDDFEGYQDITGKRINERWKDGIAYSEPTFYPGNGTGSIVKLGPCPPPHQGPIYPVHTGKQSMVVMYQNNSEQAIGYYSEVTASTGDLGVGKDWTVGGMDSLSLWVRGHPSNSAESLYLVLEDSRGGTTAVYHDDPKVLQRDEWMALVFEYSALFAGGVYITDVNTLTIGIGQRGNTTNPGGIGVVSIDDIALFSLFSEPLPIVPK